MSKKIAIIGAGATGLALASILDKSFEITLYERNERVGKKLLATGNGRCNLANTDLSPMHFSSTDEDKIADILNDFSFDSIKSFFEELGLLVRFEEDGRVYPLSNQASAVLDILRLGAKRNGAVICTDFLADKITKTRKGFEIISWDNKKVYADVLVLATGGMASPKTGSDGMGYSFAKSLGHSVILPTPALVPLKSDTSFTLPLKGIRAKAKVTLNGKFSESGEIQFTDYGLSGIASMQLSRHLTGKDSICIDFAEDYSEEYILSLLNKAKEKNPPLAELFTGILNRRIGEELIKRTLKLGIGTPSAKISQSDVEALAKAVKAFPLPVTGTLSWDNAQITKGGVPLSEIDAKTMESNIVKKLYLAGELLDCDGECGGYNLSWAWICAKRAGNAINKAFGEKND